MKAVKGYTKHDYIMICKEEGGEVFSFVEKISPTRIR